MRAAPDGSDAMGHARRRSSSDTPWPDAGVATAEWAEVGVVVLGDQSAILTGGTVGEGIDGARCRLPGRQRDPVEAVAATGTPVVAVLTNGRPFVLDWMVERVSAIVEAGFPGPGGGEAVADVIFGAVNPSGKLPVSLPRDAGVLPARFDRAQPE